MTARHLTLVTSDRGLNYLPPIACRHGGPAGTLEVQTSSAASAAYLWISSKPEPGNPDPYEDGTRHVSAANAVRFADQIVDIVGSHYQIKDTPGVAELVTAIHERVAELLVALGEQP